jgi:hypothetical protein
VHANNVLVLIPGKVFQMRATLNIALMFLIISPVMGFVWDEDNKAPGGTVVGKLKSKMDTPDGKNTNIEVKAPGEEKARKYFVNYDPKLRKPLPKVLHAVRSASVGETVELEWVKTGHGPAITNFMVTANPAPKQ